MPCHHSHTLLTLYRLRLQWPKVLSAASLALVPFKPTVVTLANISVAECHFIRAAARSPRLRPAWRRHIAALTAGGACFAAEDIGIAHNIDVLHPLWHCFACYAVAGTKALIPEDGGSS